jgi:hypothetical protein
MSAVTSKRTSHEFFSTLKRAAERACYVGIPKEDDAPRGDNAEGHEPITNAEIGVIMENGAPEVNIPARPTLIPGLASVKDQMTKVLAGGMKRTMKGDASAIDDALNAVGLIGVSAVKKEITNGDFQSLAEATLAARKRMGFKGTKPLIVTGQFRQSITYIIRRR